MFEYELFYHTLLLEFCYWILLQKKFHPIIRPTIIIRESLLNYLYLEAGKARENVKVDWCKIFKMVTR